MAELKNLKPNPTNPRIITDEQFAKLKAKIKRNPEGLEVHKILYKDGIILAGNQRFRAINDLGLKLSKDWFYNAKSWTHDQIREYIFISNVSDGSWNWEELANETWATRDELNEWGVDTSHVDEWDDEIDKYTKKIKPVAYEPKDEKPELVALFDDTKLKQLTDNINSSDVPENVKSFLKIAAYRHCVFNYAEIANFYAHSDKPTQELMEQSALIIIDYDKAIEGGYAEMSKFLLEVQKDDE
jgi:hypothetical protein